MSKELNRRSFIGATTAGAMSAVSYARVIGSNDRISIGLIGCGARSTGHRRMVKGSSTDMNCEITAICDLWTQNREKTVADVEQKFGKKPRAFKYSEELLALKDVDGVMVATGDFQHAKMLVEVVHAGKDCYCEKPMANVFEEAKLARDTVLGAKQVVQMGSQWLSDPFQNALRDFVRTGELGRITRVEQIWNKNEERWRGRPEVSQIREQDTDWKRWLMGKPNRPFDPRAYFEFRLYKDFSSGIADQWMSHGSGLVHFYMDEDIPETMTANGGVYAWEDERENPDTFTAVATYKKGFVYVYQTQFGNSFGSHSAIMGMNGTLVAEGGEGSQRWMLTPNGGRPTSQQPRTNHKPVKEERPILPPGVTEKPSASPSDDSKWHFDNWIVCMRNRKEPNGNIHTGFNHSVAVIMAARAYREGKKMYWDSKNEKILDHPVKA